MAFLLELPNLNKGGVDDEYVYEKKRAYQTNIKVLKQLKKVLELSGNNILMGQEQESVCISFTVKIERGVDVLFELRTTQHNAINACIRLLQRGNYSRPRSSEIRKNIMKTITNINALNQTSLVYFTVNPGNGTFQLRPGIQLKGYPSKQLLRDAIKVVLGESIKLVRCFSTMLLYTANLVSKYAVFNITQQSIKPVFLGRNGEWSKLSNVRELLSLSTCQISTSIGESGRGRRRMANSLENAPKILQMFYKRSYPQDLMLYVENVVLGSSQAIQKNLELHDFEQMMSYPTTYKTCPQDNRVVFSTIRILEQNKENAGVSGEGGKAKLVRMRVKFAYGPSQPCNNYLYEGELEDQVKGEAGQISAVLEKELVLKMPKDGLGEGQRVRVLNQIEYEKCVLKNLRGAMCPYLPKYYQTEQRYSQNKQALLMDYIPGPTLADILPYAASSYSLSAKLHLLMHLANAIRFLQSYDIVHLDLSPNNILLAGDGLPRLIDFGQAYHQKTLVRVLPQKNYLAGRTFPYACPETSQRGWGFGSAQDVYSFGVVAYRLLLGYFPWVGGGKEMERVFREERYEERMLLVPEGAEWVGETELMTTCWQLVLRCLHPNQYLRPHAPWVYLILKKLYEAVL